jgi:hypothetical protein
VEAARIIFDQLGGNKFLAMTGSKHLCAGKNFLSMTLAGNKSKANHLKITLTPADTYTMEFTKYTKPRIKTDRNGKAIGFTSEKITGVEKLEDVYNDQLQELFTRITGLETSLQGF